MPVPLWWGMLDPAQHRSARRAAGVMQGCDLLAVALWIAGGMPVLGMVAVHAVGLTVAMAMAGKTDLRWLLLAVGVVLGPLAGPAMLLASLRLTRADRNTPEAVADTLPPLNRPEAVYRDIVEGRRLAPRHVAPPSYATVFAAGDIATQQRALMVLARNYTPDLRPALQAALASNQPALRVQGAAVFAHLRDSYGAQARDLLAQTPLPDPFALHVAVERLCASGFLDTHTTRLLQELSAAQAQSPPDVILPARNVGRTDATTQPPRLNRHSCGGIA